MEIYNGIHYNLLCLVHTFCYTSFDIMNNKRENFGYKMIVSHCNSYEIKQY